MFRVDRPGIGLYPEVATGEDKLALVPCNSAGALVPGRWGLYPPKDRRQVRNFLAGEFKELLETCRVSAHSRAQLDGEY